MRSVVLSRISFSIVPSRPLATSGPAPRSISSKNWRTCRFFDRSGLILGGQDARDGRLEACPTTSFSLGSASHREIQERRNLMRIFDRTTAALLTASVDRTRDAGPY